jgi:oligopeptide transport system permease protein
MNMPSQITRTARLAARWAREDPWQALSVTTLAVLVLLAGGADLFARLATEYAYDEIRPEDALLPAGAYGVPQEYRDFDGELELWGVFKDGYPEDLAQTLSCIESRWIVDAGAHGAVTLERWQNAVNRCAGKPVVRVALTRADEDHDLEVTRDEMTTASAFLHFSAEEFAQRDEDADGLLSQAEFPGAPETATHWLGTDRLGRDVLTRLIYGLRVSLLVALLATAVAFLLGSVLGLACGYAGGLADAALLRFLEVLQAVPFLFVVILLSVFVREICQTRWTNPQTQALTQSMVLFAALGAVQWFSLARFARGLAVSLRSSDFVKAQVGMGFTSRQVVLRHLLPNTLTPLSAYAVLLIPVLVVEEAFLSFLGFGIQPPYPSLGNLLNDGLGAMETVPALLLGPAVVVLVLTASVNLLGERFSGRFKGEGGRP